MQDRALCVPASTGQHSAPCHQGRANGHSHVHASSATRKEHAQRGSPAAWHDASLSDQANVLLAGDAAQSSTQLDPSMDAAFDTAFSQSHVRCPQHAWLAPIPAALLQCRSCVMRR